MYLDRQNVFISASALRVFHGRDEDVRFAAAVPAAWQSFSQADMIIGQKASDTPGFELCSTRF